MNRVHKDTFKGANRTFKKIDWQDKAKVQHNKVTDFLLPLSFICDCFRLAD